MASASYVTGSHAIKIGMTDGWGTNSRSFTSHAEINTLVFAGGAPIAVAVANTPAAAVQKVNSDLGAVRPGHVDEQAAHAQLRRRASITSTPRCRRQSAPAGPWIAGAQLPGDQGRAELERLVGPSRRRLRPVRHRQDGAEAERGQVRRLAGGRLRRQLQRHDLLDADARRGSTPTATDRSSTRTATSSSAR